jgi:hypothetical protein
VDCGCCRYCSVSIIAINYTFADFAFATAANVATACVGAVAVDVVADYIT